MLRFVPFALLLALLAPVAAAAPIAQVAVGPYGLASPSTGDPYYLWARLSTPEAPRPATSADDCWATGPGKPTGNSTEPTPPPDVVGAARPIIEGVLGYRPHTRLSFEEWFPQCVAFELKDVCVAAHGSIDLCATAPDGQVSYDVRTGRWYVSADTNTPLGLKPSATYSGTSGLGLLADCLACPQPP